MGKNRTKIERIKDSKNRHLAFYKRKKGLFKKAMELSIIWDVHVMLCVFTTNSKKWAEFSTLPLQHMIDMYNQVPRKDVHIFAPSIDADKIMQEQTIKPVEWTENSRDSLLQSAELIRKRKEEGRKKEIANKRK